MARKGQDFRFLINLKSSSQEYCLEYNSDKSMILRYRSSYNHCDDEECLPMCLNTKTTNADGKEETIRYTELIPVDMTNPEIAKLPTQSLKGAISVAKSRKGKSFDFTYTVYIFLFLNCFCYHSSLF